MIKKLGNNDGVKMSSTVGGQRELIRTHRNKINEIIEVLNQQGKREQDKRILGLIDDVRSRVLPPEQEETLEDKINQIAKYYQEGARVGSENWGYNRAIKDVLKILRGEK